MAHCFRELTHEQWKVLLDDEFLHAYEHGIVIECRNGVMRRIYPRIFTYSADYPEKYVSNNNLSVLFVNGIKEFYLYASGIRGIALAPAARYP